MAIDPFRPAKHAARSICKSDPTRLYLAHIRIEEYKFTPSPPRNARAVRLIFITHMYPGERAPRPLDEGKPPLSNPVGTLVANLRQSRHLVGRGAEKTACGAMRACVSRTRLCRRKREDRQNGLSLRFLCRCVAACSRASRHAPKQYSASKQATRRT